MICLLIYFSGATWKGPGLSTGNLSMICHGHQQDYELNNYYLIFCYLGTNLETSN